MQNKKLSLHAFFLYSHNHTPKKMPAHRTKETMHIQYMWHEVMLRLFLSISLCLLFMPACTHRYANMRTVYTRTRLHIHTHTQMERDTHIHTALLSVLEFYILMKEEARGPIRGAGGGRNQLMADGGVVPSHPRGCSTRHRLRTPPSSQGAMWCAPAVGIRPLLYVSLCSVSAGV